MIQLTLGQAATILGTKTSAEKIEFQGLSIDTRTLQPGNLFIAIPGSHMDGHDYLEEARKKGAVAAIVSKFIPDSSLPQLIVHNTTTALGQLGTYWREQFNIKTVAVTGSNGKTTLKNMIEQIMIAACNGDAKKVLATIGTLNNHWGLPMTLCRLDKNHRYAVIEMGMNHFGEIEFLTKMTKPNVAVITNAAAAHLEGLGDVAGVARAKAEIFSGLQQDGVAVLNRDDAFFPFWHETVGKHEYVTFGFHPDAQIKATIHATAPIQSITLHTPSGDIDVNFPMLGKHNVQNALAATAASLAAGIDLDSIKKGLEQVKPAPGRLELHKLDNGVSIIDDSYNANPFSLQAAINILSACNGKKILVLGDMKELGPESKSLHESAGISIREAGIDTLFTFGELSANTANAFGKNAFHFDDQNKLVDALKPLLNNAATTVLVKGSRSMKMEKIINQIIKKTVTT